MHSEEREDRMLNESSFKIRFSLSPLPTEPMTLRPSRLAIWPTIWPTAPAAEEIDGLAFLRLADLVKGSVGGLAGHAEGADVVSDVRRAAYGIDFAGVGIGFDDPSWVLRYGNRPSNNVAFVVALGVRFKHTRDPMGDHWFVS